jgi:capsular polysaccharide biosynthesis protein
MIPGVDRLVRRLAHLVGKVSRHITWRVMGVATRSPRPRAVQRSRDGVVWETRGSGALEPLWGFVIAEPWRLHTGTFRSLQKIPPWLYASPSPLGWWRVRKHHPEQIVHFDEVISLRHFFEWNYYHFLIDVIPKLELLRRAGAELSVPIVVGPSAEELPFGAQTRQLGKLAELDWYVQPRDTYVRADRVRFVRLNTPGRAARMKYQARVDVTLEMIGFDALVEGLPHADRKVLLTRRPPYGRLMANSAEVEEALSGRGYEVVDAAEMSVVEQIQLFRQTRHLVAVHGAGMTNMIFRSGLPMSILELCPDVYTYVDNMRDMAIELGFVTRRESFPVASDDDPVRANLHVDVDRLLRAVDDLERAS